MDSVCIREGSKIGEFTEKVTPSEEGVSSSTEVTQLILKQYLESKRLVRTIRNFSKIRRKI